MIRSATKEEIEQSKLNKEAERTVWRGQFESETCYCGNSKQSKRPFCEIHMDVLPLEYKRTHLTYVDGKFFVNAYRNATGWLMLWDKTDETKRKIRQELEEAVLKDSPQSGISTNEE